MEGYQDQGVKVEDDWCVRATRPEPPAKEVAAVSTFEEACAAIKHARVAYDAADKALEREFSTEINGLIAQGKTTEALKIVVSLHGDSLARTLGLSALMDAGHDLSRSRTCFSVTLSAIGRMFWPL